MRANDIIFLSLRLTPEVKRFGLNYFYTLACCASASGEEKQKEVLDSIYYAKRIQTALITSETYIA